MNRTVQILRLEQPRCSQRFGVSPCTATGATECMNTFATCGDQSNYDTDGSLVWYFSRPDDPIYLTANRPDPNEWHGPCIPILGDVSMSPTQVNIGAVRDNEVPLGIRGTIKITLQDLTWKNSFGDFYGRDIQASFSRLLLVWLGEAAPQLTLTLFSGFEGQTLDEMTARRFDVDVIQPPQNGTWLIEGIDPLGRISRRKAKFPRETELTLQSDVSASQTSNIRLAGAVDDLTDSFGNTAEHYVRLGDEVLSYTGQTDEGDGVYLLSGVIRGTIGTVADSHAADDPAQRVGYFEAMPYYQAARYILSDHTTLTDDLLADWEAEGQTYLSLFYATGATVDPTDVWEVVANLMRDGMFTIFWDEVLQEVDMAAMRQPAGAVRTLTDRSSIVKAVWETFPDQRMTRVLHMYDMRDPTGDTDKIANFKGRRQRISGKAESAEYADGTIRSVNYYSRHMRDPFNAFLLHATLMQRYEESPEYLKLTVTQKDSDLRIGDVVDVQHSEVFDLIGNEITESWQLIRQPEETKPGELYTLLLQSFTRFFRPAFIAADDAPDFASATGDELLNTCYITENDGTMPDGSEGWVIQ